MDLLHTPPQYPRTLAHTPILRPRHVLMFPTRHRQVSHTLGLPTHQRLFWLSYRRHLHLMTDLPLSLRKIRHATHPAALAGIVIQLVDARDCSCGANILSEHRFLALSALILNVLSFPCAASCCWLPP